MKSLQVLWTQKYPKKFSYSTDVWVFVGERGDPKSDYFSLEKGLEKPTHYEVWISRQEELDLSEVHSFPIGTFTFAPMYGCCGVVISAFTYRKNIDRTIDGQGVESDVFRYAKTEFAKALGYSAMIATTQMANIPGVKNMFKSGYKFSDPFVNGRTKNLLGFGFKKL